MNNSLSNPFILQLKYLLYFYLWTLTNYCRVYLQLIRAFIKKFFYSTISFSQTKDVVKYNNL